jgi:hypothetical protein
MRAIQSGRRIREVGRAFNIPESTLRDKMKSGFPSATRLGRKPVFTAEQEKELANHILKIANTLYGMSPTHLRKVAYEFAEANSVVHNFHRSSRQAGKDWLQHFTKRNP